MAFGAFGEAKIVSVTPNSGAVTGSELVTIQLSGFSTCNPCAPIADAVRVYFGNVPATAVSVVNANTITARTPPHFRGRSSVTVRFEGYPARPLLFRIARKRA